MSRDKGIVSVDFLNWQLAWSVFQYSSSIIPTLLREEANTFEGKDNTGICGKA